LINKGFPPTALKARTGLFTPPGITLIALSNNAFDMFVIVYLPIYIDIDFDFDFAFDFD
jgi:hypothetical protein